MESSVTISVLHQKIRSKKQTRGLVKRLFRETNKLGINATGILVRKTSQLNQAILPETLKWLVYQELHERLGHLDTDSVYLLAKDRFY